MMLDLATTQQAATVALNLSVAVIIGASMSTAWLLAASSQWAARHLRRLCIVTRCAVAAAIVAAFAVLWLEAAAMAEVPVASAASAVWSVLTATHYGLAWSIGIVAMAVVAATTAIRWRPGRRRHAAVALRLVAIGVFLYSRSIVSHAGAGGDVSWAVAADWLHLVLISLWVGEVLVAGFLTLRDTAGSIRQDRLDRARYVEALSASATIALTGIVVTGLFGAWRGLGSLDNATGNPYAGVLLIKVSLVAAAAALGGANRLLVMQPLIAQLRKTAASGFASERRFALILQLEAVILFAALILAAILSSTSPPTAG
jgi:putative copper resistance protein D